MSANTAPMPAPATPAAPATRAAQAVPSADTALSDLATRRLTLTTGVDELTTRPAPNNLAKITKLKARERVQRLCSQAASKAEETVG